MMVFLIAFLLMAVSLLIMQATARLRGRNFHKPCCSSLRENKNRTGTKKKEN